MIALLFLASTALAADDEDKGEQLRRAMAEIALMNTQMTQRKADAAGIREELSAKQAEIQSETAKIIRENKIQTSAGALDHPRIHYNLKLMAEMDAYIQRYGQKIAYYRIACDRLSYLYQQADDDLKIVNTLSNLKIDALIGQTEKILDQYLSEAQTIVISPATLSIKAPDHVLHRFKGLKK
jgi:hypothetical protein